MKICLGFITRLMCSIGKPTERLWIVHSHVILLCFESICIAAGCKFRLLPGFTIKRAIGEVDFHIFLEGLCSMISGEVGRLSKSGYWRANTSLFFIAWRKWRERHARKYTYATRYEWLTDTWNRDMLTYTFTQTTRTHTRTHAHTHARTHARTHTHLYTCKRTSIHPSIHPYKHTHLHTCTCTYSHMFGGLWNLPLFKSVFLSPHNVITVFFLVPIMLSEQ